MKDDQVLLEYAIEEPQALSDYETERGKPMPNIIHSTLQSDLIFQLRLKYDAQFEFPSELTLDLAPPAVPDICVYLKKGPHFRFDVTAKYHLMPLTAIEIVSPSQSMTEMTNKVRLQYFPAGVESAWLVEPALKTIFVMLPDGRNLMFNKGILHDPTTGIKISVDKVFERIV